MVPSMQDYEKLGVFYLGRRHDPARGPLDELLLYDARDLTTHGVIVGMTGSGKTGLAIALLEELAIDGIPALAIDPKGDLGNLALQFPGLSAAEFRPWIDEAEAARAGLAPDAQAAQVAEAWRRGLADSGQDAARIARLRAAADVAIYTPGSSAGLPLSILRTLAAPSAALAADDELFRERVASTASSLLALLGVDSDPRTGREHILLSRLVEAAWRAGRDLDLAALIRDIQKPPFERVGVMDVETFFPGKERLALALRLNNLLASSGFEAWMQGEPLDVQRLLWTPEGRPRVSVISIAHLGEAERQFFVTLLLNEVIAWMRGQAGTSSLRAVLYMDEVFGYFPPVANPPSKQPMLTLLKQARAFGLGVVLATQNPVDLDYKGLSNCGTWWLGRLQTDRDRMRVLDGLEGAAATSGIAFDRGAAEALLAGLPKRTFLMSNVHESGPVMFQTRWTLSYLAGPLARPQIKQLMEARKAGAAMTPAVATPAATAPRQAPAPRAAPPVAAAAPAPTPASPTSSRPVLPPEVREVFVARAGRPAGAQLEARLLLDVRLHYVDAKSGVDCWQKATLLAPVEAEGALSPWEHAEDVDSAALVRSDEPAAGARFGALPPSATSPRTWPALGKSAAAWLYQARPLHLLRAPALKLVSRPGESAGDFRARVALAARELRDRELEKLQARWAPKLRVQQDRERRVLEKLRVQQAQYEQSKVSAVVSVGSTLLGALFGRKLGSAGNVGRAGTAMRGASRAAKEKEDIGAAQAELEAAHQQLAKLTQEFEGEAAKLRATLEAEPVIETLDIAPRRTDIVIESLALAWLGS
ncbi:MAG TPA: helicase HerA-like domain-containing protein [Planctomycetota bacterium]|nr:helicase HerA-like domain-containing protein [Planctomycetota bacterium]